MRGDLRRALEFVAATALVGCSPESSDETSTDDDGPMWPLPRRCEPPPGLGSPATIEQVVELVNALPKPTSLPCLLESLDRPATIYASTSTAGAQPASGPDNPRIFLLRDALTMSIVPLGSGSDTLELSVSIGDRKSIKAELVFPVMQALPPSAPYDAVDLGGGTTCGGCHGSEARVPEIDFANAWSSDVYQDDPDQSLSISYLRQSARDCDHEAEPARCEMLDAVFGHGELDSGELPRDSKICRPL